MPPFFGEAKFVKKSPGFFCFFCLSVPLAMVLPTSLLFCSCTRVLTECHQNNLVHSKYRKPQNQQGLCKNFETAVHW